MKTAVRIATGGSLKVSQNAGMNTFRTFGIHKELAQSQAAKRRSVTEKIASWHSGNAYLYFR
jgi:hypothetical protein